MKRRLCSYDMVEVPPQAFVLIDLGGEMFFCNLRCLCVWSTQLLSGRISLTCKRSGAYAC